MPREILLVANNNSYAITRTYTKEVYVEYYDVVECFQEPCLPIKVKRKLTFSKENMKKINEFIDSLFADNYFETSLGIRLDDIPTSQKGIMNSIIYQREELMLYLVML